MAPTGIEPVLADRKSAVLATRRRGPSRLSVGPSTGRPTADSVSSHPYRYERMFVGTGTPRKPEEREQARRLRSEGLSIKRIAAELSVSPSSVFYWTRDSDFSAKDELEPAGETPSTWPDAFSTGRREARAGTRFVS